MNRYNSYKDSGVEWIGEIPKHWILKGLRFSFKINKGKIPKTLFDKRGDNMLPYLSMDVLRNNPPKEFSNQNDGLFVRKGEIGILWDGSNSGEIISINQDGILSSTVSRLGISDSKLNKEFSYYILKFYEKDFRENTIGMGIPHMDGNHLKFSKIILPPLEEQQQIVSFLDDKTQKIDSLIQQKEKKIELLKEKRTSLINHVVTKGLDSNVEMKDSGVEWIGEIPNHWGIPKLSYLLEGITDGTHGTHERVDEGELFLSSKNVTNKGLSIGKNESQITTEEHEKIVKKGYPVKGDILITVVGSIGRSCVYEYDYPISFQRSVCFLRLRKTVNEYFMNFLINSDVIQFQLLKNTKKSTQGGIYMNDLKRFDTILPPISEQQQIVEYLDKHTEEIDTLIQLEQKKIDILKEYRQSLISEVVTGKIKVV